MSSALVQLSDAELMQSLQQTMRHSRRCLVELLQQLSEIERRRLHLARGHSSMFALCRSLRFSEGEAYKRIAVARASVSYPTILQLLASGELHLTGAAMLAPQLTPENAERLLLEARGKSKLYVQKMLATLKPSGACAADLRRLGSAGASAIAENRNGAPAAVNGPRLGNGPHLGSGHATPASGAALADLGAAKAIVIARPAEGVSTAAASTSTCSPRNAASANVPSSGPRGPARAAPSGGAAPICRPPPSAVLEPTAANVYRLRVSFDGAAHEQLLSIQGMLRHKLPSGDINVIIVLALDALAAQLKMKRFGLLKGQVDSPSAYGERASSPRVSADKGTCSSASRNTSSVSRARGCE